MNAPNVSLNLSSVTPVAPTANAASDRFFDLMSANAASDRFFDLMSAILAPAPTSVPLSARTRGGPTKTNASELHNQGDGAILRISLVGICDIIEVRVYGLKAHYVPDYISRTCKNWLSISITRGLAHEKFMGTLEELGQFSAYIDESLRVNYVVIRTQAYLDEEEAARAVTIPAAPTDDSARNREAAINAAVIVNTTLPDIRAPRELKAFLANMGLTILLNALFGETSLTISFDPAISSILGDNEFSYQFSKSEDHPDWDNALDELVQHLK